METWYLAAAGYWFGQSKQAWTSAGRERDETRGWYYLLIAEGGLRDEYGWIF